jgi:hypothetical protein
MELVEQILRTEKYCSLLVENISDVDKPSVTDVAAQVNSMGAVISIIQIAEQLDAYVMVDRENSPNTMWLNPLLLMQIKMREMEGAPADLMRKYILLLAAKIIRAFSHLIHPKISPSLRNQVKKRSLGGEEKRGMRTPERSKNGAMFDDFGEMMECDILGGILDTCTEEKKPAAYAIDELIVHKYSRARSGTIVKVKATDYVVTADLSDLLLEVGDEVDQPYKGDRDHLIPRYEEIYVDEDGRIWDPTF